MKPSLPHRKSGRIHDRPGHAGRPAPLGRDETGAGGPSRGEWIYGRHPVRELLRAGKRHVYEIRQCDGGREGAAGAGDIDRSRLPADAACRIVSRREMDGLFPGANHQGVAVRAGGYPYGDERDLFKRVANDPRALVLGLDHLEDPQNLGALLRSAEAVGVTGVMLPRHRASGITPAVVRASSGASEHLYVVRVSNLSRGFEVLRTHGARIWGLDDRPHATRYDAAALDGRVVLVVGAEGRGLGRLLRERCDGLIRLPMRGHVASLNASVAGGIVLFEWLRQNRPSIETDSAVERSQ